MSYLKIKNLISKLDSFSLHIKDVEIEKGSFFGVLGYSGAGKSTLLNLICGLEKADSGSIFLEGKDITDIPVYKREIAYVFQNSLLFEGLSVKENLAYLLTAKSVEKNKHEEIIQDALFDCEVSKLILRDITTLSGGEKQRVAMAMALMFKPKLLILDEPFSNLDTSLKIRMRAFLKTLIKKHNMTVIMVTHDKDDAFELCDKMVLLSQGKIIQQGTPQELYENPMSLKCAQYFGLENIFYGEVKDNVFTSNNFSFSVIHKDIQNAVLIVPFNSLTIDISQYDDEIISMTFIDGRWKNRLKNGIVFFSINKLESNIKIIIDSKMLIIREAE
jgi:ABC-type Fe3+/spermidine/putrescine transport system ATPase subunit